MTRFLTTNWLWIVFLVVMLTMHRRGGCGTHRQRQQERQQANSDSKGAQHSRRGKDAS